MPQVLIWITCRNYERYLPDALRSAQEQTHPCMIYVAHDNCGRDQAAGTAATRNRALMAFRPGVYDYLLYLDADDILPPDYVESLLRVARGDCCVVACDGVFFGETGGRIKVQRPTNLETLLNLNTVHVSCLIHTSLLRAHGGFDAALPAYEDWDLWCRLAAAGVEFRYCPDVQLRIRKHADSRHAQRRISWQDAHELLIKRYDARLVCPSV